MATAPDPLIVTVKRPLNFREPIAWLIIVCLIFFSLWQCESGKRKDAEHDQGERLHQEQIQELQATAQTAAARADELQAERAKMRDSAKVQQQAQKEEIRASKVTIAKLRVNLQPKIDSFPELGQLIYRQDMVIKAQDSLILALETAHSAEIINLEGQLSARADMILAEAAQKDLWRLSAESAQKDVRKANRRKSFWRTSAAILAGGVIFLTIQK